MHSIILLLHILGATVWVGGHLVVALTVLPRALKQRDPKVLLDFESSFEKLGMSALALQVLTGLWLAYQLVPSIGVWFELGNPVAHLILCKLALLLGTVALAVNAQTRIIPTLTAETLPNMASRVRLVTVLAVLFVVVGASFRGGLLMPWL